MFKLTNIIHKNNIEIDSSIEDLLIRSVHSDQDAKKYFEDNTSNEVLFAKMLDIVEESESGDARMEGAYWLSQCDNVLIKQYEGRMLKLMDEEWDSIAVHIMMALSKIRSREAFVKIIHERIQTQSQWDIKALMNYIESDEQK